MNLFSKSNLSLLNKIMMAFVAYVMVMLIVFSVIVIMIDRGHVKNISDDYSLSIAQDKSKLVEKWLDERIKDVQLLSVTQEVQTLDAVTMVPLLREAAELNSQVYGRYFYINSDGVMTDTLGIEKTLVSDDYKSAMAGINVTVVTEVIEDSTFKQPTFNVMVPVVVNGSVKGILGSTILVSDLVDLVSKESVRETGHVWVVNKSGLIISHKDADLILGESLIIEDEDESSVEKMLTAVYEMESGMDVFKNDDGEKEYVTFDKIDGAPDWYVMVTLYKSTIYSTVGSLIGNMALLFVLLVILSGAVSYFLAKDITKPIESLINVTTKFTTGVKGIRAKIESKDEIGQLAQSFNNMADTIVAHTDNLEELIKERTQTLADLNYQIVSRNKELGTMNEELEKTNNKLHELASTDMLTGLYNRHQFQRDLQTTIELVNAGKEENFALVFIDLDNFKYYNDTFSHEIGDFLLELVAGILKENVRDNDIVGRYGGDEFVILLRQGDYNVAKSIAERMHKAILDRDGFKTELRKKLHGEVKIMGKNKLSSSIGIVNYMKSMNITDAEDLLAKADETMYKAKKAGKSRVVVG